MGSTNTLNNQGFFFTVHFLLPFTVQPHPKTYYIPRPSKGCQMVPKDLSIHHPLGFNWHPLEGAGSFLLPFTFPEKKSHSNPQARRPGHRGQIQQWPPWRGGVKNEVRPQNRHAVSGQRSSKKRFFVQSWKAKCPMFKAIVAGFGGKVAQKNRTLGIPGCLLIKKIWLEPKKPPSPSNSQIPRNYHPTFNTSTHHICFTLENHSTLHHGATVWCAASSPCGSREGMASSSPSHRLCQWSSAPPTWYSPDTMKTPTAGRDAHLHVSKRLFFPWKLAVLKNKKFRTFSWSKPPSTSTSGSLLVWICPIYIMGRYTKRWGRGFQTSSVWPGSLVDQSETYGWRFRKPANSPVDIGKYPMIYKILYMPGGSIVFYSSIISAGLIPSLKLTSSPKKPGLERPSFPRESRSIPESPRKLTPWHPAIHVQIQTASLENLYAPKTGGEKWWFTMVESVKYHLKQKSKSKIEPWFESIT